MSQSYRTDLTDEQWELLKKLIPPAKTGGRPRSVDMRAVINAIFYVNRSRRQFFRLIKIWVDGGYRGENFMRWVMDIYGWILETVLRSDTAKGFEVLPRRWVVERTFGWFNWCRRLSKDYEVLPATSEAMIQVAMIRIMLRRLA